MWDVPQYRPDRSRERRRNPNWIKKEKMKKEKRKKEKRKKNNTREAIQFFGCEEQR